VPRDWVQPPWTLTPTSLPNDTVGSRPGPRKVAECSHIQGRVPTEDDCVGRAETQRRSWVGTRSAPAAQCRDKWDGAVTIGSKCTKHGDFVFLTQPIGFGVSRRYFARLATKHADRPIWIISDARRPTDIAYFEVIAIPPPPPPRPLISLCCLQRSPPLSLGALLLTISATWRLATQVQKNTLPLIARVTDSLPHILLRNSNVTPRYR
jgi:hypothetical protein